MEWQSEVKRSQLAISGVRYAYLEAGEGPLVLLAHGTFAGKELLRPQLAHLSRRFRCVAFDWPGHGESGFNPGGWGPWDLVEDVVALIEGLGEESAFLGGVSQGGAVFSRVALAHPERVRGLVNMSAGPGPPPPAVAAHLAELAHVLTDEPDEALRRHAASAFADTFFHAPGFADRDPSSAAAEIEVMVGHPRAGLALVAAVPPSYDSIIERLSEIAAPVLVIWGDQDPRPALGAELAAAIPGAQLLVIQGAGHHVNVDAPIQVSEAIDCFLQTITAAGERGPT